MALKEKLIDKAQKLIQKGYLDKAIVEYRAAADADPRDISIRLRIGDLYVKLGKKSEAVKEYTEAARANAQRGFYLKAIAVYKQVLKLEENLDTHNKLAELYLKQRLIADAMGEYSHIVHWFENRGKTSEVLELLKKMVDIDPENVGVRLKLADLYQKLSFDKDSLSEYSIIFEKLLSAGKLDKAEKIYLSLYNANPSEERVLSGLAELYRVKGDDTQRLKFLKGLFNYYSGASMTEEARRAAQEIIRINPDDPHAARFLRKDEKSEPQVKKASPETEGFSIASSIEVPVDGVEEKASEEPIVSWPEEEIEITIEGFEEGGVESRSEDASMPESEIVLEAGSPPAAEAGTGAVGASVKPPAAQASHAGTADEIDIDIDDLIRGDLPRMDAVEVTVEPVRSEPPLQIADDAQAPVSELTVEEARIDQVTAPAVSEQVEVEETAEEAGIEDVISVISAELQEDLSVSGTEKPSYPQEPPVEAPEPVLHVEESMEPVEAETTANMAVEGEQAREDVPAQTASGPEQIAEIESEPEIELLELDAPSREAVEAPLDAVEVIEAVEAVQARAASDESESIEAVEIKAEPLPEEPSADASITEVSDEDASAPSQIEVQLAEPVTDIMEEAFPETPEEDELDEDLSSAIQELMEKMEPEESRLPQEQAPMLEGVASKEEYVDLSAELGMEEALKDLAGPWGGKESAESFDEFKDGIGNQLNKEDSETHYNLGIAYMEMELFSEASKEFKIALKDARLELDCYTRLGLCAMAEKNPEEAAGYYSRGLKAAARSDEEKKAFMYELALAYEASGRDDEALEFFREIFAMDPDYREAALKVSSSMFTRPLVPLDDGYIEVELL
ncbi:MAG: hypothetical protein A2052_01875 [Deltaproteobacteria bacterium GWA2_54_12]|nr:MAG: hypothetical protein A2052_01875 [Deltaproteobacteria bacterium GWA2_54_12]